MIPQAGQNGPRKVRQYVLVQVGHNTAGSAISLFGEALLIGARAPDHRQPRLEFSACRLRITQKDLVALKEPVSSTRAAIANASTNSIDCLDNA
jgi:hypothetical protein